MNNEETKKTELTLVGPVRLSYANIFRPRPKMKDKNKSEYKAVLLFPKEPCEFCRDAKRSIDAARAGIKKAADAKFPAGVKYGVPLLDGDREDKYPGFYYMNVKSDYAPAIVGPDTVPVTENDGWASGDWARVVVSFYGGEDPDTKAKNVGAGLRSLQFVAHDQHFGGGAVRAGVELFEPVDGYSAPQGAGYDPFEDE